MVHYKNPANLATKAQEDNQIPSNHEIVSVIDRGNGYTEIKTRSLRGNNPLMRYMFILKDGININGHKNGRPEASAWLKLGENGPIYANRIHFVGTAIQGLDIPQNIVADLISIYGAGYRYIFHEYRRIDINESWRTTVPERHEWNLTIKF
jgi:hypothetical protein